jgi:hypothetical protein
VTFLVCRTPYGSLAWVSLAVTFSAALFFMLSAFKCFLTYAETPDYKVYLGYWSQENPATFSSNANGYDDGNHCVRWDSATQEERFDGIWRFGKALGMMGTMVATILFIICIYIIFFKVQTKYFTFMLYSNIFLGIASLLFLTSLASDVCKNVNCKLGPGGYMAVLGFFLWMAAAYVSYKLQALSQEPEYEYRPSISRNQVTETSIVPHVEKDVEDTDNDDGTVTQVTTITTYEPEKSGKKKKKKVDKVKRVMNEDDAV